MSPDFSSLGRGHRGSGTSSDLAGWGGARAGTGQAHGGRSQMAELGGLCVIPQVQGHPAHVRLCRLTACSWVLLAGSPLTGDMRSIFRDAANCLPICITHFHAHLGLSTLPLSHILNTTASFFSFFFCTQMCFLGWFPLILIQVLVALLPSGGAPFRQPGLSFP